MKLETKRLILRIPRKDDWKDIVEGVGEYDVSKMLLKVPYPYKKKDAVDFIGRKIAKWKQKVKDDYLFFIELKSEKKVIGAIGIHKVDNFSKTGETGSWINKKYWRNGYMTEAKIAVNDFAFNKLKLRRLDSPVYTDNVASNATQLKMGYKLEGVKRKTVRSLASGKIHDENIYGLLKEDWVKVRPKLIKQFK
ncbi:MAG TPA: GNAT family protein [Candidatus Paceibacterota bacterium]|nr:GNAT family protein [Candidatus Paceibacterota bacterium]